MMPGSSISTVRKPKQTKEQKQTFTRLRRVVKKAIQDYGLIEANDHLLVILDFTIIPYAVYHMLKNFQHHWGHIPITISTVFVSSSSITPEMKQTHLSYCENHGIRVLDTELCLTDEAESQLDPYSCITQSYPPLYPDISNIISKYRITKVVSSVYREIVAANLLKHTLEKGAIDTFRPLINLEDTPMDPSEPNPHALSPPYAVIRPFYHGSRDLALRYASSFPLPACLPTRRATVYEGLIAEVQSGGAQTVMESLLTAATRLKYRE
eukprot:gnl/Dysnectes_brevis/3507_a4453_1063.p1 GENE.gnl/Dysnectes_brevis/3507_a4453_1063~~gnl/Dysnectes_brevis/3507_a4453_1063.p1  ORF type:complete len:267 (+),score=17.74 gnl/Dysnectes_brevis/3507_a4453_1063:117-917(+)